MTALAVALIVIALVVTVLADDAQAPVDHGPGVSVDIDRSKPRPVLSKSPKVRRR